MRFILLFFGFLVAITAAADEVDFTLTDINGKRVSLSDFRGKWVIVNYWATWCPPCLEEIPDLVDFHEKHKDSDAVVLGIAYEEVNKEYLQEFVESHFMSYPVMRMDPVPVTDLGPVTGLPTTYIISPAGERIARQEGPITGAVLEAYLERKKMLLNQSPTVSTPVTAAVNTR